jgi:hypothetical protein
VVHDAPGHVALSIFPDTPLPSSHVSDMELACLSRSSEDTLSTGSASPNAGASTAAGAAAVLAAAGCEAAREAEEAGAHASSSSKEAVAPATTTSTSEIQPADSAAEGTDAGAAGVAAATAAVAAAQPAHQPFLRDSDESRGTVTSSIASEITLADYMDISHEGSLATAAAAAAAGLGQSQEGSLAGSTAQLGASGGAAYSRSKYSLRRKHRQPGQLLTFPEASPVDDAEDTAGAEEGALQEEALADRSQAGSSIQLGDIVVLHGSRDMAVQRRSRYGDATLSSSLERLQAGDVPRAQGSSGSRAVPGEAAGAAQVAAEAGEGDAGSGEESWDGSQADAMAENLAVLLNSPRASPRTTAAASLLLECMEEERQQRHSRTRNAAAATAALPGAAASSSQARTQSAQPGAAAAAAPHLAPLPPDMQAQASTLAALALLAAPAIVQAAATAVASPASPARTDSAVQTSADFDSQAQQQARSAGAEPDGPRAEESWSSSQQSEQLAGPLPVLPGSQLTRMNLRSQQQLHQLSRQYQHGSAEHLQLLSDASVHSVASSGASGRSSKRSSLHEVLSAMDEMKSEIEQICGEQQSELNRCAGLQAGVAACFPAWPSSAQHDLLEHSAP